MVEEADQIITMGCNVEKFCPAPLKNVIDWRLEEPKGKPVGKVRKTRDEIEIKVLEYFFLHDFDYSFSRRSVSVGRGSWQFPSFA